MSTRLSVVNVFSESNCVLRTDDGHLYHLNDIQMTNLYCYSPVTFFPSDIMHVLEGLMVVNVSIVLKHLARKKIMTMKSFNERLAHFQFGPADSHDRFGPLPLDFVSKNKAISGKAVEKWCFFRLLAVLIGELVSEDYIWKFHILCMELCEIILMPQIDPVWLPYLELLISQHHKLLEEIAPGSFTRKIHFVTHYPRLILEYGLLHHLWVMRFEAAHQYFKQIAHRVQNFSNITSTLSKCYQDKKCYEHAANCLLLSGIIIPCSQKRVNIKCLSNDLVQILTHQMSLMIEIMYSVNSMTVNDQAYHVGCYIVSDTVHIGLMHQIVILEPERGQCCKTCKHRKHGALQCGVLLK